MELYDEEEKETCLFATIKGKMAMFSELDQKRAKAVRELQERLGFPSNIDLAKAIEYNTLGTCQFNIRDIRIASLIFGPYRAAIEGKSTQSKNKMDRQDKVLEDVPPEVINEYKDVHIDIDIMYVNKIAFFTAISRDVRLIHTNVVRSCTLSQIKKTILAMKAEYKKRGFSVKTMHGDSEFASLKEWTQEQGISLETCDTDSHVPAIERTNHFLKERI